MCYNKILVNVAAYVIPNEELHIYNKHLLFNMHGMNIKITDWFRHGYLNSQPQGRILCYYH